MLLADEVLKACGDFGPAQWLMLLLFCVTNVLSAFHYFAQTFITLESDVRCDNTSIDYNNSQPAPAHYQFYTLTEELDWSCDKEWMGTLVQSMFFLGSVGGTMSLGMVADRLGRRPALVLANVLAVCGNLLTAYLIPNVASLGVGRFVSGLAVDSNFFMMYILVMEYIRPGMRTVGLNLCIGVFYCLGCMATPWLAILCKDWRIFLTAISFPVLIVPILVFFIPESAQWQLSRGRDEKALKCFKKLAAINRRDFPVEFIPRFQNISTMEATSTQNPDKGGSIRGLFATPKLRKKTCILIFKTMVLTLCYDAISRNIQGLGYDPFTMFTVTSATIFPSCVVILLLQDRVGRKAMAVLSLLLTGILALVQGGILAMGTEYVYAGAMVGICSRFAINIAYNSGTQYAAELIPTQVRAQGLSAIHVVGYLAAFFSPQVLYMSKFWEAAPEVLLGGLAVLGAAFCMLLPETLGRTLPVTLEDGEAFGEDEKFWQFTVKIKNGPHLPHWGNVRDAGYPRKSTKMGHADWLIFACSHGNKFLAHFPDVVALDLSIGFFIVGMVGYGIKILKAGRKYYGG